MGAFDGLVREAFLLCAVLALPAILVATLVGTAVAILQAATQVHEQTLTLLPKLIAIGTLIALFGAPAMHMCADLFDAALAAIPSLVRGG